MRIIRCDPTHQNPWSDLPAGYAIICSDTRKLIRNAQRLRRLGQSVYTQYSGKRKAQLKRAQLNAYTILDFDHDR